MRAFALMQHILSSDKHIVLYDECEDTICYDALERKAGINTMLEKRKITLDTPLLEAVATNQYLIV